MIIDYKLSKKIIMKCNNVLWSKVTFPPLSFASGTKQYTGGNDVHCSLVMPIAIILPGLQFILKLINTDNPKALDK